VECHPPRVADMSEWIAGLCKALPQVKTRRSHGNLGTPSARCV